MTAPYNQRCARPNCKNFFLVGKDKSSQSRLYCEEHSKTPIKSNNPKGYNKYKSYPVPVPKPTEGELKAKQELYEYFSHEEKFNAIKELGNTIWRKKCELLKLQVEFRKKQVAFFGWDWKKVEK